MAAGASDGSARGDAIGGGRRGEGADPGSRRVKRRDPVRHLETHGCEVLREAGRGTRPTLNRRARKASTVPRHREVNEPLARKICRDLEVPEP